MLLLLSSNWSGRLNQSDFFGDFVVTLVYFSPPLALYVLRVQSGLFHQKGLVSALASFQKSLCAL